MVYNWEDYKDIITRLYVQENKQVDEIIRYMRNQYDFKPRYVPPTPGFASWLLRFGDDFFGASGRRVPCRRPASVPEFTELAAVSRPYHLDGEFLLSSSSLSTSTSLLLVLTNAR